jgi:hypothetical protein
MNGDDINGIWILSYIEADTEYRTARKEYPFFFSQGKDLQRSIYRHSLEPSGMAEVNKEGSQGRYYRI